MDNHRTTKINNTTIGTLREYSLHAELKTYYAQPGDRFEVFVDGYWIDILREKLLIEIQIGNFWSIKQKIKNLISNHKIHLVYPLVNQKWIIYTENDIKTKKRKSPKHGRFIHAFEELVFLSEFLSNENFTFEILLTSEEHFYSKKQTTNRKVSWRRKGWVIEDKKLISVISSLKIDKPNQYIDLAIPYQNGEQFTAYELAKFHGINLRLANKIIYTLKKIQLVHFTGKKGRANIYTVHKAL